MKFGVIIGSFLPLHNGSLTLCKVAKTLSEDLIVLIINKKNDPISIDLRISWLKIEFPTAIIEKISTETIVPNTNRIKFVLDRISKNDFSYDFHIFSSDTYAVNLAKELKINFTILDPDRLAQNIQSENLLANPYGQWFEMPFSVRSSLIRRVVLIGPESVGKSTLANKIKSSFFPQPFLPEYGRPYEIFRDPGPYHDDEFEKIISVHAAHRKALLPFSGPIFVEDTDELTTAVWVEMLMQKQLPSIEIQIKLPYHYLLMDPTVPFTAEKTRYFDKQKRIEFFEKIKNKLDHYNASYQILTGSWSAREIEANKIIKKLLSENLDWSEISQENTWV